MEKRFGKGSRPDQTKEAKTIREIAEGQGGSVTPREPEPEQPEVETPQEEELADHAKGIADAIPVPDSGPPQAPPAPRTTGMGGAYDPSKEDVDEIVERSGPREGRPHPPPPDERDTSGVYPKGSGVNPPPPGERRT